MKLILWISYCQTLIKTPVLSSVSTDSPDFEIVKSTAVKSSANSSKEIILQIICEPFVTHS